MACMRADAFLNIFYRLGLAQALRVNVCRACLTPVLQNLQDGAPTHGKPTPLHNRQHLTPGSPCVCWRALAVPAPDHRRARAAGAGQLRGAAAAPAPQPRHHFVRRAQRLCDWLWAAACFCGYLSLSVELACLQLRHMQWPGWSVVAPGGMQGFLFRQVIFRVFISSLCTMWGDMGLARNAGFYAR